MNPQVETTNFLKDLDRVVKARHQIAEHLDQLATTLRQAETEAESGSGKLGLEQDVEDITHASQNLKQGVFRLMVLGDMKRGKSTFLNALIGENLLPSDVNPCTALLTILRYGPEKQAKVYFNDGKEPEIIDFKAFKTRYTIDPDEAKELQQNHQLAFPDVSYAEIEYPLPILEKGVEIVDSPGLNDTEARNALSLGYVQKCHAILFVMRASQPCTLSERRYLENYIKDRGLSIFFLINAWDQVKEALIDPDDADELAEAEDRLRKVFRSNLADYCIVDGYDIYHERVFEISALKALRKRLKDPHADLEDTGFSSFMSSLNTFLTQERAVAELRQARLIARQAHHRVREAVDRRIPLLNQSVNELKDRIHSVEPEFERLTDIRDQFKDEIRTLRDHKARLIADSFRSYVLGLEQTFEEEFLQYQPNLSVMDLISQSGRDKFNAQLQQAFQQYVNTKFYAWTLTAERELDTAFVDLSRSAAQYGASYTQITQEITQKLTGQPIPTHTDTTVEDASPGWARWAMGLISLASGNIAGVALAATGFDWKSILFNFLTISSVAVVSSMIFGVIAGPVALALMGLGLGALQADHARKELVKATKKELVKYLPQVAQEQWQPIYGMVQECFDTYEREVIKRINDDIQARRGELDALLKQKETHEINRESELNRLQSLERATAFVCQDLETTYQEILAA